KPLRVRLARHRPSLVVHRAKSLLLHLAFAAASTTYHNLWPLRHGLPQRASLEPVAGVAVQVGQLPAVAQRAACDVAWATWAGRALAATGPVRGEDEGVG